MPEKSTKKKKTALTKEKVLDWYMKDILEGNEPQNIYLFSKNHGITEPEFYTVFNSFEGIENHFLSVLFEKTLVTLQKSTPYSGYSAREKLLSFYYTFFANLTSNRSFVLCMLKPRRPSNLLKFRSLRKEFLKYIDTLGIERSEFQHKHLKTLHNHTIHHAAWMQLLATIRFWYQDDSPGFEKTDIFIEKSMKAGFDLIEAVPLKSVADFGKFLVKEINPVE